jgi:hypothetical protein
VAQLDRQPQVHERAIRVSELERGQAQCPLGDREPGKITTGPRRRGRLGGELNCPSRI